MGNPLYKLKCQNCGYEQDILWGFTQEGNRIKPYYCSKCKEFKSIIFNDNQPQNCDICGSMLNELHIELSKESLTVPTTVTPQVHCPKCKSANVEIFLCGVWD
ncbi:MAG: hypothetical protein K6A44_02390 [bacterium]|nr:hypothetical protein [bacterium]